MSAPIVLVAGTWGLRHLGQLEAAPAELPWWHPEGFFGRELRAHGLELVDAREPFLWSTSLDGIGGSNLSWYAGGAALRYFAHAKHPPAKLGAPDELAHDGRYRPVSVIAHSHGGQVALYAASQGLVIDTLVTVATPVRLEMEAVATKAQPNMRRWIHVYSDADAVQVAGAVGDGRLGIYRQFRDAANILEPGAGHSDLHDHARWTARQWWKTFFAEAAA